MSALPPKPSGEDGRTPAGQSAAGTTAGRSAMATRAQSGAPRPKVVVLREPARSVRADDEPSRAGFRLGLACACAGGALASVWLLGHLGFRLGVAPLLGVPELLAEPGEGLATGAATLLRIPLAIHRLALDAPMLILVGFAALALPAAGLTAARPIRRGGPAASAGTVALSTLAVILAIAFAAAQVAWTLLPLRQTWLMPLPSDAALAEQWANGLDLVAGVDTLALAAMVLWCILAPRLATATWLRTLGVVLTLLAAGVGFVGAAASCAGAAHAHMPRSVVRTDNAQEALLLGYTRRHTVLLRHTDTTAVVVLADAPPWLVVIDRRSIVETLRRNTAPMP